MLTAYSNSNKRREREREKKKQEKKGRLVGGNNFCFLDLVPIY